MQKMVRHPPEKQDVIVALMKMLRQPTTHQVKMLDATPANNRDFDTWALNWKSGVIAKRLMIGSEAMRR